ncbi:MAG: hypothetical protein QW390_05050 [Candidatus Bathyarchaeia archaeon]
MQEMSDPDSGRSRKLPTISQEYRIGEARIRLECITETKIDEILTNTSFLTYILAGLEFSTQMKRERADILWYRSRSEKILRFDGETLTLEGGWTEGEVQRLIVPMLRRELERRGFYAFHAAVLRFMEKNIMFMTGEENHGKTMSLIECCRRGGRLIGTESIICDEDCMIAAASKKVFLESEERSKGTERVDKPSSHQGIQKFFDSLPEFKFIEGEKSIDMVFLPDIDGNYDTFTAEMEAFEKEYQTFQCLSSLYWLTKLLAPQVPMPIFDDDVLRQRRARFTSKFAERPYYFIRGSRPQVILDEVEKVIKS